MNDEELIGDIIKQFPSVTLEDVLKMSDRDIINAYYPHQRPKQKKGKVISHREAFTKVLKAQGYTEAEIESEWRKANGIK